MLTIQEKPLGVETTPADSLGSTRYWAFISYSHSDADVAKRLQRVIEEFRVPRALVGRSTRAGRVSRRIKPIFRDEDELSAGHSLAEKIREALLESRWLIVVCSPASARSEWVGREIEYFQTLGRADGILCLIVGGEPGDSLRSPAGLNECFAKPLLAYGSDLEGKRHAEPLAADVRWGKDKFRDGVLRLLAGMIEVGYDDLKRRDLHRRRARQMAYACSIAIGLLLLTITYIGLADRGANVPFAEWTRRLIDRYECSIFRPCASELAVDQSSQEQRSVLIGKLTHEALASGGQGRSAPSGPPDVWVTAQAVTALLWAPELSHSDIGRCADALEPCFSKPALVAGRGWSSGDKTYCQAEPSLWMIAAIANLLARPQAINAEEREKWIARLGTTQEIAQRFRNDQGAWYSIAGNTLPTNPSNYATALGLFALLETRSAGLPWTGDQKRRDEMLRQTAAWLISQFQTATDPPGWLPTPAATGVSVNGLTIQIYDLLLRAHVETGLPLPDSIRSSMLNHLLSIESRGNAYPSITIRPRFSITDFNNGPRTVEVSIRCLWRPWALLLASQWLNSDQSKGVSREYRTRVKRVRGYLVLGFPDAKIAGWDSLRQLSNYTAAEHLISLSALKAGG